MWVCAGHDHVAAACATDGAKACDVDAERHELDARRLAVRGHVRAELRGLVLAVRDDCGRRRQRPRVQAAHPLRAKPFEALGKADRDVHERRTNAAPPALSSISGIPTVSTVERTTSRAIRLPERRQHRGEVAAVPACSLQRRLERRPARACPGRRLARRARDRAAPSTRARRAGRGRRGGSAPALRPAQRAPAAAAASRGRRRRRTPSSREVR